MLTYTAWAGRPWLARLLLLWWIVPFALMSIGTSKMFHYTYPFLPPIALGVGLVADTLYRAIERGITRGARLQRWPAIPRGRPLLAAVAVVALAVAVWTAVAGQVRWDINGVLLLRNSSVARPLILSGVLWPRAWHSRRWRSCFLSRRTRSSSNALRVWTGRYTRCATVCSA
jgi:hypothetical protein